MARENAQRLEKSVTSARTAIILLLSAYRKMSTSWKSDQQPRIEPDIEEFEELFIGQVQKNGHDDEWTATLQVNDNKVQFKLDTGAQANLIPKHVFNSLKGTPQLRPAKARLIGFNDSEIPVVGVAVAKMT